MKIRLEFELDHIREVAPALRSVLVDERIAVPTDDSLDGSTTYEEAGQGTIEGLDLTGLIVPSTELEILRFSVESRKDWAMPNPVGSKKALVVSFRPGYVYTIMEVHA